MLSKIFVGFIFWCIIEFLRDLLCRYVSFCVMLYKIWCCFGYERVKFLVVICLSVFCKLFLGMNLYISKWELDLKMYVSSCIKLWWWMNFRVLSFVWICFVLNVFFLGLFLMFLEVVLWMYLIVIMRLFWRGIWYILLLLFCLSSW